MLTREALKNGWLQRLVAAGAVEGDVLSEEALAQSRAEALKDHPPGEDVWLFAYGSLIWNPAFHYAEAQSGTIFGYHRRFCLWTHLGRGSRDCPGLVLGLDRGGSCRGVFYRVAAEAMESELPLIWRREMVTASYVPTWVKGRCDGRRIRALTFVINRQHPRYAADIPDERIVESIATAQGPLGPCCEYLFNTAAHLAELGLHDRGLDRLCQAVRERRRNVAAETPPGPLASAQT